MAERERVHVVCEYMRKVRGEDGECQLCPRWEDDRDGHGRYQRMCRGLAEEIMSIVIRGTPYPPRWERTTPRAAEGREGV